MHDPAGQLGGPEHDVEVLAPVELGSEPTDTGQQVAAEARQVPEVGIGQQEFRIPVGLEVGMVGPVDLVELVLVGVDDVDVVVGRHRLGHLGQGLRLEQVVVVEEEDELAPWRRPGHGCSSGRCRRSPPWSTP